MVEAIGHGIHGASAWVAVKWQRRILDRAGTRSAAETTFELLDGDLYIGGRNYGHGWRAPL